MKLKSISKSTQVIETTYHPELLRAPSMSFTRGPVNKNNDNALIKLNTV